MSTIAVLLKKASDIAGHDYLAAKAIGIGASRFSKLLHHTPGSGSLSPRACFRLARYIGESPQAVLRAAGKHDLAEDLDQSFGTRNFHPLPAQPPPHPLVRALAAIVARQDPVALTVLRGLVAMADQHSDSPASAQPVSHNRAGRRSR
jgi:plasmid maintenance system antidote protein VapI